MYYTNHTDYFFTSNTSNRINSRSTIFILATCYLLISSASSEYNVLLVLSFFILLFGQMIAGNLISINIRGISNFRKRKPIFTWCRKQKANIFFRHSTKKNEAQWKREWGAPFFCSHGANNALGVAILIGNNFDCIVEQKVADAYDRCLILKVPLNGKQALLVSIHGPNKENKLVAFYLSLLQIIVKNDFDTIENIIMSGDLNCPLNPTVDKRGCNLFPRHSVVNTIEELQSELDLHYIWRIKNPTTRIYTCSQSESQIFF